MQCPLRVVSRGAHGSAGVHVLQTVATGNTVVLCSQSKANGETTEWEQSQVMVMLGEKGSKEQEPSFSHP